MAFRTSGVMKARQRDTSRRREIVYHAYEAGRADSRVRVLEAVAEEVGGTSLNDSSIIIGIGRGVKTRRCADEIRKWAERIGAMVAGSRAAVEAGLVDASVQVGQTGHTIARICISPSVSADRYSIRRPSPERVA